MTRQQEKILDTLIYFLERYKKAVVKSDQATGFEDLVFDQMIDTVKELQEENERLSSLNKPKILSGGIDEGPDSEPTKH
jgi:hypothetical protein|tara:strand:- start:28 stop:264 length:237 start_codon:yes stop_codon:yes gene_type:complete